MDPALVTVTVGGNQISYCVNNAFYFSGDADTCADYNDVTDELNDQGLITLYYKFVQNPNAIVCYDCSITGWETQALISYP